MPKNHVIRGIAVLVVLIIKSSLSLSRAYVPLILLSIALYQKLYIFLISEDLRGIFVKSVIEGSMADRSGCIMVNDQITEVDGTSLAGITNQQAVEVLKHTGSLVQLTIVRYLRGLKFEELQDGIKAANVPTPTSLDYMTSSFLSELGGVGGNSEAKVVPTATEVEVLPVRIRKIKSWGKTC